MYNLVKHNNELVLSVVLYCETPGAGSLSLQCKGYWFSLPRLNLPGHDVNHPPLLAPTLEKEYSYTFIVPLGLDGLDEIDFCV